MKVKKYIREEWFPKNKSFYVLFDTSNGDSLAKRYLWWFDTYEAAMSQRRHQTKMKYGARLSMPVKVSLETELK